MVKERKKTDNPREGWEDGTPPPHRDFKGPCVFSVYVALTNIPVGELLTGFAMRSDPNVVFG